MLSGPVRIVPVFKLSETCEVSILEPPEVSVVNPGGLFNVLSDPPALLSEELHAIAYDKTDINNIFLIGMRLSIE